MSASRSPAAVADRVVVPAGTTCADAVAAAGLPTTGPKAIVVVRDADRAAARPGLGARAWTTEVEPVAIDSPDGLNVLRHSTAHVLAQAVQDVFPEAKLGIGPPIENGFYYDFEVAKPFQPGRPRQAREADAGDRQGRARRFRRRQFSSLDEAKVELADEPFKLELVDIKGDVDATEVMEVGGGELTIYDNLDAKTGERALGRPVPRAAPAVDQAHRRVQAHADRRGVLARVGEEPAAAAGLRHRVADPGRAQGVPAAA